MTRLTYEERLLLDRLLSGPQPDHDRTPERVLVHSRLAQRIPIGQIEITAAGRARAAELPQETKP